MRRRGAGAGGGPPRVAAEAGALPAAGLDDPGSLGRPSIVTTAPGRWAPVPSSPPVAPGSLGGASGCDVPPATGGSGPGAAEELRQLSADGRVDRAEVL